MPNLELSFSYDKGWDHNKSLFEALCDKRSVDIERGYTSVGPQSANIIIRLNGKDAQKICSRGQQKLIANTMLLSQAKDFYEKKKKWVYEGVNKSKGTFKNGKRDGLWETYDPEGNLESSGVYKDGELIG